MNIWWLVFLAVAVVLTAILVFRLHAFLTLLLAGLLVAALTTGEQLRSYTDAQIDNDKMSADAADKIVATSAPARLAGAFGETAGKIGILIALASIIGQCLLESGAASTIVERMLRLTGPRRAPEALAASAFVLGIPVFFDTVFYLMIPLARSLRRKLGSNYVLYILAILAGGSIAHSLVPPTPGPLLVAGELGIDIGTMMVAGLVIGGCSSVVSLAAARLINRLVDVPLRFDEDTSDADQREASAEALAEGASDQDQADKPSLLRSLAPIAVPVLLISIGSVIDYAWNNDAPPTGSGESGGSMTSAPQSLVTFLLALANKNVALGIGVVLAFSLVRYCPEAKRATLVGRSLASAGNIILITAAGGAFGAMLRQAGIEGAVGSLAQDVPGIMILPVAFAVTAAIRTLQGSATVAMITAVGVLQGFAPGLPFHPVYLAMAIGAGSKPVSWMTDSAFWVITRMSGMTEAEGLRVISPMSIAMGFAALAFTMLFAWIYPAL
jgi:GntP family gluconate:H+ symporter